jgi:hypothetical protein
LVIASDALIKNSAITREGAPLAPDAMGPRHVNAI